MTEKKSKPTVKRATKDSKKVETKLKKTANKPKNNSKNYYLDPAQLVEAGSHYGHQVSRWNPQMGQYIFTDKNNVHVIDLVQTAQLIEKAANFIFQLTSGGGIILFVGTKRQAAKIIQEAAEKLSMPYVNRRWLGGMLTNFSTISERVKKLKKLELSEAEGTLDIKTKKELLKKKAEIAKLNLNLSGLKNMDKLPDAIYVIDMPREMIAIKEARKLSIPVVAIADTNSEVGLADYPIPANDDAIKSISLITDTLIQAASDGKKIYDAKTSDKITEESDAKS